MEKKVVEISKNLMQSMTFQEKYKKHQNNFSRQRKMTFLRTIRLVLRKSGKSLPQMVNKFFNELDELSVTKQSFSRDRRNLKYEARIECAEERSASSLW